MITPSFLLPLHEPRDATAATRQQIDRLTEELASGRKSDLGNALSSDFSVLSRISNDLQTSAARESAIDYATSWSKTAQTSLDRIRDGVDHLATQFPATFSTGSGSVGNLSAAADGVLSDIGAVLQTSIAGRSVFGNGDIPATPLIDMNALKLNTQAIAAGATNIGDLMSAFDAYFSAGGGYETNDLADFRPDPIQFPLGDGVSATLPVDVGSPGIRQALKHSALIAALPQAGFTIDTSVKNGLASELARRSASATSEIVSDQAQIGSVEQRLSRISKSISAERVELETRRAELVAVDPYETATGLEAEITKLETLYAIASRRSNLSLANYLR